MLEAGSRGRGETGPVIGEFGGRGECYRPNVMSRVIARPSNHSAVIRSPGRRPSAIRRREPSGDLNENRGAKAPLDPRRRLVSPDTTHIPDSWSRNNTGIQYNLDKKLDIPRSSTEMHCTHIAHCKSVVLRSRRSVGPYCSPALRARIPQPLQ